MLSLKYLNPSHKCASICGCMMEDGRRWAGNVILQHIVLSTDVQGTWFMDRENSNGKMGLEEEKDRGA